jgi:predicted enzyme related to lactoylglutathione lyase
MADKLLGSFVWCELMTTDPAAAESFYKKVVGWTPVPFAPDGSYTVFNNPSGAGVAGLMKLPDAAKQMGAPPHWMMYVGTPNVDETAVRIAQLGGRVLKQPEDIPNTGRFAVVQDPHGATFGIFQPPANRPGRGQQPGVGDFSWFELYTPNPDGAWKFYETLFGWEKTTAMDMGDMGVYQMFGRGGGVPNGGIMKPPPGAPAAWMPYAMVKDAKAAAATATANGGKIVNGPMEVPGGDWIAQGMDPQGAMFSVHSLNPATQKAAPASAKASTSTKATADRPEGKRAKPAAAKKKAAPAKAAAKKTAKKAARKTAKKAARTSAKASAGKPKKAKARPVKKSAKKAKPARKKAAPKRVAKKKAAKRKK